MPSDFCAECGRAFPDGGNDLMDKAFRQGMAAAEPRLHDGVMLAKLWLRSSDQTVRQLGADLKQVLEADS